MMEDRAMRRTTLSHAPQTVLGFTAKGRPIRFIGGGSQPTGEQPAPPTPPAAPPAQPEGATPPAPPSEEPLGAPGLRALQAERERAASAEAALAAANARISEFEQANLSELERERTRAEQAETALATERTQRLRLEAASTHGIPAEHLHLLTATTETDLTAQATSVAALLNAVPAASPPPGSRPLPGQGTPPAAPSTGSVDAGRQLYERHKTKT